VNSDDPKKLSNNIVGVARDVLRHRLPNGGVHAICDPDAGLARRNLRGGLEFQLELVLRSTARCEMSEVKLLRTPLGELIDAVQDEIDSAAARMRAELLAKLIVGAAENPIRFADDPARDLEERRRLAALLAPPGAPEAAAVQAQQVGGWQPAIGDVVEAVNIARRYQRGTVVRHQGGRLPWIVRWPDGCETGYAAHEIVPAAEPQTAPRFPIERYVRACVEIPGSKGRVDGVIEIGMHYEVGERPGAYRGKMIELGDLAARCARGRVLNEDTAAAITEDLDERIVALWGADRARFIEIWRGTGDDAEPLTQVYKPHGMPIARPRAAILQRIREQVAGPALSDGQVRSALLAVIDELGGALP
jgi:hypothetical protein